MHAVAYAADSGVVTEQSRGGAIRARLDALGISDRDFEARSGINRQTLRRAVENDPRVKAATYLAIEAWLDRREESHRGVPEDPHVVTFHLSGNFGVDVVISGPVENLQQLEESVQRLIRGMGQGQGQGSD